MIRILTLCVIACFLTFSSSYAAVTSGVQGQVSVAAQKEAAHQFKMQKRMAKAENFMQKHSFSFDDPVGKWLVYACIGWGAGIILGVIAAASLTAGTVSSFGILYLLAYLCYLAGTVSFVVWLVKKFA